MATYQSKGWPDAHFESFLPYYYCKESKKIIYLLDTIIRQNDHCGKNLVIFCLDAENMYKHEFTMGKRQVVTNIDWCAISPKLFFVT